MSSAARGEWERSRTFSKSWSARFTTSGRCDERTKIVKRDERSWLADGKHALHDVVDHFPDGVKLAPEAEQISTVAGLVLGTLERLPEVGTNCNRATWLWRWSTWTARELTEY